MKTIIKTGSKTIAALATVICLLTVSSANAEIYKWTDADGNVHYGDRPVGDGMSENAQVEVVAVASRRTSVERVQETIDAGLARRSAADEARSEREAARKEAEDARAEAEDRAEKCTAYRARLEKFVTSRRLYRMDDNGERQYLDDTQMATAREQVQQRVEEYCAP